MRPRMGIAALSAAQMNCPFAPSPGGPPFSSRGPPRTLDVTVGAAAWKWVRRRPR